MADFIRSTGPDRPQENVLPLRTSSRAGSEMSKTGTASTVRALGRKISNRSVNGSNAQPPSRGSDAQSTRPRIQLEPRSPAAAGGSSADMIDFIRQGPPVSHRDGQHRIPRTVAPFRSTVDSDEFNHLMNESSKDNTPLESMYGSTRSKQSTRASTNSRTELLPAQTTAQPSQHLSAPEPQIVRKRRRVRDPYAIDTDSEEEEEDDLLTALPKPKGQQEESLVDFLNSAAPPSDYQPQPFVLDPTTVARARIAQANGGAYAGMPKSNGAARVGAGQAVISSTITGAGRPPARSTGARDARTARADDYRSTNDLADFLRSSGPPEPITPRVPEKEEKRSMASRLFRRKVVDV